MTKDQALDWITKHDGKREIDSKTGESGSKAERIAAMRWTASLKIGPNGVSINGKGAAPHSEILDPFLVAYFIQRHGDPAPKKTKN
jgi:hypothetical protein